MSEHGRIHREFFQHRKVKQCSNGAIGLWAKANAFTRFTRSGGYIGRDDIMELGTREEANELVAAKLWETVIRDGEVVGVKFKDYCDWNDDVEPDTDAGNMVRQIVPESHPSAIRKQLARQAALLLREGIDHEVVAGALKLWLSKNLSPSLLPSLCSEAMKEAQRAASLRNTINECIKSGKVSPLKAYGYLFTPPDTPPGLGVDERRAFMDRAKRDWLRGLQKGAA